MKRKNFISVTPLKAALNALILALNDSAKALVAPDFITFLRHQIAQKSDEVRKDAYNRDRGIARLRKAYKTGRITKSQVNKRGYNKFLEISKDIEVVISEEKIA